MDDLRHPPVSIHYGSWLSMEHLRADGSNFSEWYNGLKDLVITNDISFTLEEELGPKPEDDADMEDYNDFIDRRDYYLGVTVAMKLKLCTELRMLYGEEQCNVMWVSLKDHFPQEMLLMKHRALEDLLSCKMEEHTHFDTHLRKMNRLYYRLVTEFDYWTEDNFGISAVLMSLPPSYKGHVEHYVKNYSNVSFEFFMAMIRNVVVDPIEPDVINPTGIYLIYML